MSPKPPDGGAGPECQQSPLDGVRQSPKTFLNEHRMKDPDKEKRRCP